MTSDYFGKRILVAGKGISGAGATKALERAGATCAYYGDCDINEFAPELIVVSPGIKPNDPVFGYAEIGGTELIGELELGYRLSGGKDMIAVTGTNGKTTVTRMIAEILRSIGVKAVECGNIGVSYAGISLEQYDCAVVEASSFQLATTVNFKPRIAVITNISPDHLNYHGDMAAYVAAKMKIAANQGGDDSLILSADDIPLEYLNTLHPKTDPYYTSVHGKVRGAYIYNNRIYFCGECVCELDRLKAQGLHNCKNALSAVCAAKIYGADNSAIVDALSRFEPDAHRLTLVARHRGKNYYNDSKGTNIAASVAAAKCMVGSTCMIVGGSDKGYEYDLLFELIPPEVTRIAAVGETAEKICAAAKRQGFINIKSFSDLAEAFTWANDGDEENLLLSPASASFDAFSSYIQRGELFEKLVHSVAE